MSLSPTRSPRTVSHALGPLESGARRVGGQRHVPLQIWRTEAFQSWLAALEGAGNELGEARQEWIHRVGPCHEHMLFSVLQAVVFVTAEDRLKSNEVVLSRPDVASVVAYRRNGRWRIQRSSWCESSVRPGRLTMGLYANCLAVRALPA
jgi:hypothetical protein